MLEKDAILSKISIIKNCLKTIEKITELKRQKLDDTFVQDVFVLNLQRAAQASIDMANIIIAEKGLKLPATYKQSFKILAEYQIIANEIAQKMMKMVGFRNIAIHDYQELDVNILKSILSHHLKDFEEYYSKVYKYIQGEEI